MRRSALLDSIRTGVIGIFGYDIIDGNVNVKFVSENGLDVFYKVKYIVFVFVILLLGLYLSVTEINVRGRFVFRGL